MTHADALQRTVMEVASKLPGFDQLNSRTQEILFELGEEYFHEEYVPRLEGIVNLPRYQEAMYEKTLEDRAFIEDQVDFLEESMAKAQRAAHAQLLEKLSDLTGNRQA